MALSGFNIDEVNACTSVLFSAYDNLYYAVHNDVQNNFINGMADKWACNAAQNFFGNQFKPNMETLIREINATFENIVNSIFSAADLWARETGWEFYPATFQTWDPALDTSRIQENIGGVRGIDLETANDVVNTLVTVKSNAENEINRAKSAVQNSGFIGGNQQQNLIDSLNRIGSQMNNNIESILNGTKDAINQTVQSYSDTRGAVAQKFQASN